MNVSNLEKSSIDEVLSKSIDFNWVSSKKTFAGLDSFRVMTKEPVDDQIYFNGWFTRFTSSFHMSTEFVTDVLCSSISKENNLILMLNTDIPQLSYNSTVLSIPTNFNNPLLVNIVDKASIYCVKSVRIRSYSSPHFPAVGLNTERYGVSPRIQSEYGKIRTRISSNRNTFHAMNQTTEKHNLLQWKVM